MKKNLLILLSILCTLLFAGCGKDTELETESPSQDYFNASVLEIKNDTILAECIECESGAISVGSQVSVSMDTISTEEIPLLVVGDTIRVVYIGEVMESDPIKLQEVISIFWIDENGEIVTGGAEIIEIEHDPKEQASQTATIGNPWSDWNTIEEAESVIGFSFGLPEVIADSYDAVSIRTLTDKLIEVVYRDDEFEVCVRKQKGEGQDISGDYNEYETCTEENYNGGTITNYQNSNNNAVKQIISYKGYSWSLVAPNGYWGDSNQDFVSLIMEE